MRRTRAVAGLAAGLGWAAAAGPGCKRSGPSQAPIEWQEPAPPPREEALETLSPPWEEIEQESVPRGPLVTVLREPDTPWVHLRILLPLPARGEHDGGALQAGAFIAHARLLRSLTPLGARVERADGADRIELVVHSPAARRSQVARHLAVLLTRPPSPPELRAAERALPRAMGRAGALAAAEGLLLGLPPGRDAAGPDDAPSASRIRAAWQALLAPDRAVLIVHQPRAETTRWLAPLLSRWTRDGAAALTGTLARLRPAAEPPPAGARPLLGDAPPPLWDAGTGPGPGEVVLARRLDLPTPRARAQARLAARLLQQGQDLRLALRGDVGILVLRVPLPGKDPAAAVRRQAALLSERAREPRTPAQIRQAARAWLGARVVQASLDDEDWTGAWSQAIDLATRDEEIAGALAAEARAMQDVSAEELATFMARWCDPAGAPGWLWVLAGGTKTRRAQLAPLAPVRPVTRR